MVIFCCGMRCSASTLQYHLVRELLPHYTDLGHVTWQEFAYIPDSILKCHPFLPDFCPTAWHLFESEEARAVYIYRDIRDVVASMLRMEKDTGGSFISSLEDDVQAIISSFYKWTSTPCVYIARYESLKLEMEVLNLAQFLGVKPNPSLAEKYTMKGQKDRGKLLSQVEAKEYLFASSYEFEGVDNQQWFQRLAGSIMGLNWAFYPHKYYENAFYLVGVEL